MASPQFDFPEPFGPVIAVKPRSIGIVSSPLNDLKFETSNALRYIPFPRNRELNPRPYPRHPFARGLKECERYAPSAAVLRSVIQEPNPFVLPIKSHSSEGPFVVALTTTPARAKRTRRIDFDAFGCPSGHVEAGIFLQNP